jgi:hypothetical protein
MNPDDDLDEIEAGFQPGEWVMLGYDNDKDHPVIMYSPKFASLGPGRRHHLLMAWLGLMAGECSEAEIEKEN